MKELAGGTNVWHSNHENTGIPTKPEVRKQNAPSLKVKFIEPMKARLTETLPEGDWIYEIKLDGFRAIALKQSDYLDTLKRHGVAHVFNSWGDMPPVNEQLALAGSVTNPEFAGARFLLKPGRKYQEAWTCSALTTKSRSLTRKAEPLPPNSSIR